MMKPRDRTWPDCTEATVSAVAHKFRKEEHFGTLTSSIYNATPLGTCLSFVGLAAPRAPRDLRRALLNCICMCWHESAL